MVITSKWHSAYPNNAHEKRGKEVGLPVAAVEAIIAGLPTAFEDAREQVVYEVAMALANVQLVPQELHDSRREGTRPREHHRHDRLDGLLYVCIVDDEFLCGTRGQSRSGATCQCEEHSDEAS